MSYSNIIYCVLTLLSLCTVLQAYPNYAATIQQAECDTTITTSLFTLITKCDASTGCTEATVIVAGIVPMNVKICSSGICPDQKNVANVTIPFIDSTGGSMCVVSDAHFSCNSKTYDIPLGLPLVKGGSVKTTMKLDFSKVCASMKVHAPDC